MSRSELAAVAAGAALGAAVVVLWKRSAARASRPEVASAFAPRVEPRHEVAAPPPAAPVSSIMQTELERLARVAVSHGPDDPAVDVFLAFVGALDPLPVAATLEPAAQLIGKQRLEEALDRPGESRLGASRLLAATAAEFSHHIAPPAVPRTVTVERPVGTERRLPDLFDALLHAIRGVLSLLA